MKCRLRDFNSLIATLFHSSIFIMHIIMHIISMGLICMLVYAEAYLEPSKTSAVELPWENYRKA